jgi:hypothetical protein
MSRKQDIAITNIMLPFGQIMLVSQKSLVMILERCAAAVSTGLLHCTWSAYGPSVWTGRALQGENDDLEKVGLALLYPAH